LKLLEEKMWLILYSNRGTIVEATKTIVEEYF